MFSHYKKLLFSPVSYVNPIEGGTLNEIDTKDVKEQSAEELLNNISNDNRLDGNDKLLVEELKSRFEADKSDIDSTTDHEKSLLKESIKESLMNTLSKGYTLSNEADYHVLKSMIAMTGANIKIPENYGDIANLVGKEGERREFSFIYKQGENNISVYDKFTQKKYGNDWTSDFGLIDVKSGEFKEQTWSDIQNNDINIDDSGSLIPNDRMSNNNEFSIEGLTENQLMDIFNNLEIPEALYDNHESFDIFLNEDVPYSTDQLKQFILDKKLFISQRVLKNTNFTDSSKASTDSVTTNGSETTSELKVDTTVEKSNESPTMESLKSSIDTVKNKFTDVNINIIDGKCYIDYKNGFYKTYFTIDSPSNKQYSTADGLQKLVEKKLNQWGTYEESVRNSSEKQTAPEDVQPVMDSKVNTIEKVTDEEASFSESVSETFDNAVDSTVETYNEVKETVLETYEQSVQWLREYFKEFPDAGKIDLGNGEFLEVEYDSKNNKLYVDTQFFDGISDYKSEVDLGDIANKTPEQLKELISDKNAAFLKEYKNAIESKEIQKQNKSILEVFSGNKRFTNVGEVKIGEETMDVRLIRTSDSDVKIKLNTPFGDNISDKDVTLDFASKKSGGFDTMKDLRSSIQEKTKELEKSYKDLYKKNNPEKEAA